MKKNIMIFMLLLSFLVGVGVPVQAKADSDTYIDSDFVFDLDTLVLTGNGITYTVSQDILSDISNFDNLTIHMRNRGNSFDLFFIMYDDELTLSKQGGQYYFLHSNLSPYFPSDYFYDDKILIKSYSFHNYDYEKLDLIKPYFPTASDWNQYTMSVLVGNSYSDWVYFSSKDIYTTIYDSSLRKLVLSDDMYYVLPSYGFDNWCSDAGLSCAASINETEELYDFTFNPEDYHYIVRRNRIAGSKYTLYLSQVTKEEDLIYYSSNRALADSKIGAAALYVLSGEYASGSTSICNYVYDSTGGGWLYTDNYGVDLGFTNDYFVDDIGISFSSSMPIVYSSTDIFSDKEQSSVYYAADTEFKDPFVVYPNISPTSTPTPTPISNSGSSDLGGNVVAGGGIDFIISIVSQLWSRVFSIPMYVDGFQINLQQIYVYGILAGVVGGAIVLFARRK